MFVKHKGLLRSRTAEALLLYILDERNGISFNLDLVIMPFVPAIR